MSIPKVITVAGSDSSGGAGIQADLKTCQELGVYGMTALTTIVAMNPDQEWGHLVFPVELATIKEQMKTILKGIGIDALKTAAAKIHELGAAYILIKGGSKLPPEKAIDLLYDGQTFELFESERIETPYIHGAGCTFAAAITAELAKGKKVREAIRSAKAFITVAIKHGFPLNQYVGSTLHMAHRVR